MENKSMQQWTWHQIVDRCQNGGGKNDRLCRWGRYLKKKNKNNNKITTGLTENLLLTVQNPGLMYLHFSCLTSFALFWKL